MGSSSKDEKYIRAVYDDVLGHLNTYRDPRIPKLHFGAFGPDVPTTSETFSIPIFHLPSIRLDPFLDHCSKHPCYIESEIVPDRNGRHTLYLHFYWVDKTQEERSLHVPKISKRVRFASSSYPSAWEAMGYLVLAASATIFGMTKATLFGI
jgi:hypothetical protein